MDSKDWAPFYAKIVAEFGFDARADASAANDLATTLRRTPYDPERVWDQARAAIEGHDILIVGAADDAARRLRAAHHGEPVIAADGATTACLEARIRPTLIVSDLDGNVPDEIQSVHDGSLVLVHAHGDNRSAVQGWLPKFDARRVAGTCQTPPIPPLRNLGGFTDGDRAAFIAHGLGARRLHLVGFALEGPPGRYSGTYDPTTKPRKLAWARRLLDELAARGALIDYA